MRGLSHLCGTRYSTPGSRAAGSSALTAIAAVRRIHKPATAQRRRRHQGKLFPPSGRMASPVQNVRLAGQPPARRRPWSDARRSKAAERRPCRGHRPLGHRFGTRTVHRCARCVPVRLAWAAYSPSERARSPRPAPQRRYSGAKARSKTAPRSRSSSSVSTRSKPSYVGQVDGNGSCRPPPRRRQHPAAPRSRRCPRTRPPHAPRARYRTACGRRVGRPQRRIGALAERRFAPDARRRTRRLA